MLAPGVAATLVEARKVELVWGSGGIDDVVDTACRNDPVALVGVVVSFAPQEFGVVVGAVGTTGTAGDLVSPGSSAYIVAAGTALLDTIRYARGCSVANRGKGAPKEVLNTMAPSTHAGEWRTEPPTLHERA